MIKPKSLPESKLPSAVADGIRSITRRLLLQMRAHGGLNGMRPSHFSVLFRLEIDGPSTVSALARSEGMRPQSMSAIVTPLQDAGLVGAAPDKTDGRQTLISLTRKGAKFIREGRAARQDWLTGAIAGEFSVQEQKQIVASLALLERLIDD